MQFRIPAIKLSAEEFARADRDDQNALIGTFMASVLVELAEAAEEIREFGSRSLHYPVSTSLSSTTRKPT